MSITSSSDTFMNSYRHSTNSVYGTLNPHIQIPISSSTTIPSSAYHFQNPPTSNNNSNSNTNTQPVKMSFCQTIQPPAAQTEDKMDEDLPADNLPKSNNISINLNSFNIESNQHSSLKTSSSHVPTPNSANNLKFSQSILPPPTFVNDNNNLNTNSNNNINMINEMHTSPSSSSLSLSSFNEAIMSAASNSNNSSSFSSLSSSPNHTSTNSNPLLKLSALPDSSPPIGMTSPFSYSSSAVFQNPSSSSSFCGTSTTTCGGSSIGFSSSPTSFTPSPIDDDRERMRYEFESIKKPEQHHRKSVKSHHRHYSHNDLDSRKHDEEKFFSSLQPNNYSKNRYHDVLPNESTRVRLTPIEPGDGDYINANYINGEVPNSYRYYIACQAPLQSTIKDFWRMVWEEKSAVIVCLTRLEEDGKKKADIYWPESSSEPQECGPFWVHLHKKVMFKDIGVSSLHLYRKGEEFPREVVLFHYTQWPDSGAPNTSTHIRTLSVLTNTFKQRGNMKNCNGPVIVHCSAGIGRSGTFIAININMAKIERSAANNEPNVNIQIKETVVELRRQRRGMVQTFEQYVYIYRVINDVLNDMGRSLASPTKRRSCEMIRQPAMPRLDINSHQPPATFNPKDIQSITSSAETAASLSIITQMTQTLKFPQSTQFDSNSNPFSKSKIKIPSPLNVSSSNILTVPPTSLSSQLSHHHHQRSSSTTHIPSSSSNFSGLSSHHLFQNNSNSGNHGNHLESLNQFGSFGNQSFLIYNNNNNNNNSSQNNQQQNNTNENNQKSNGNNSGGNCNMSFQYNFQNNNDDNGGSNFKQMPQLNINNNSTTSTSDSSNNGNNSSNNNNSNNRNGGNQDHEGSNSQQQQQNSNGNSNPPESPRTSSPIKCF